MIKNSKLTPLLIAVAVMLGLSLHSCGGDSEPKVTVFEAPSFTATNISVKGDRPLTASDNKVVDTFNYSVTITVNGESQTITGSCSSNELPVIEGNEVEIVASFDGYAATSNICLTMPDGIKKIVSKDHPTCQWIVPMSFSDGDKITAQWADTSGNIQYDNLSSSITLISLEK